jgi:hypothetical protein
MRTAHQETEGVLEEVRGLPHGCDSSTGRTRTGPAIHAAAARPIVGEDDYAWHVSVDGAVQLPPMTPEVEAAAYHIAVEALTDAYRQSHGQHAHVQVSVDPAGAHLTVEITDDGIGFESSPRPVSESAQATACLRLACNLEICLCLDSGSLGRAELAPHESVTAVAAATNACVHGRT